MHLSEAIKGKAIDPIEVDCTQEQQGLLTSTVQSVEGGYMQQSYYCTCIRTYVYLCCLLYISIWLYDMYVHTHMYTLLLTYVPTYVHAYIHTADVRTYILYLFFNLLFIQGIATYVCMYAYLQYMVT